MYFIDRLGDAIYGYDISLQWSLISPFIKTQACSDISEYSEIAIDKKLHLHYSVVHQNWLKDIQTSTTYKTWTIYYVDYLDVVKLW